MELGRIEGRGGACRTFHLYARAYKTDSGLSAMPRVWAGYVAAIQIVDVTWIVIEASSGV